MKETDLEQIRLLLEELCCDLCRFMHGSNNGLPMESVQIDREFYIGAPDAFADIRIIPGEKAPYFLEVKYGYGYERLLARIALKYGPDVPYVKNA